MACARQFCCNSEYPAAHFTPFTIRRINAIDYCYGDYTSSRIRGYPPAVRKFAEVALGPKYRRGLRLDIRPLTGGLAVAAFGNVGLF